MICLRLIIRFTILLLFSLGLGLEAQTADQGQAPAQTAPTLIPGRFIVVYRNAAIPRDLATGPDTRIVQRHDHLGIAVVDSLRPRTALSISDDAQTLARLAAQPNVAFVTQDRIVRAHNMTVRAVPNTTDFSPLQSGAGIVAALPIQPDIFYTLNPQDWAVQAVGGFGKGVHGGPSAIGPWDVTTGTGVRIAILDSGVDAHHPDIAPNLALNLSEVDQAALPSACDDGSPQDQTGHGTWAASLAAAAMGPNTGLMVGVAPTATLLNIKVMQRMPSTDLTPGSNPAALCAAGQASGLLSWVIQGIDDAVTNHADIISLSLGTLADTYTGDGAGLKATFDHVTHAAFLQGSILIAAAGNDGLDLSGGRYVELPAQSRDVLAIVASTNPACRQDTTTTDPCTPGPAALAYYSNFGAPLNALAAPGGSYPAGDDFSVSGWVRGACSAGLIDTQTGSPNATHPYGCFNLGHTQYVQAIGTSASAPLAAGVAALYRAAYPSWTPTAIVAAMRASAVTLPGLSYPQLTAAAIHP